MSRKSVVAIVRRFGFFLQILPSWQRLVSSVQNESQRRRCHELDTSCSSKATLFWPSMRLKQSCSDWKHCSKLKMMQPPSMHLLQSMNSLRQMHNGFVTFTRTPTSTSKQLSVKRAKTNDGGRMSNSNQEVGAVKNVFLNSKSAWKHRRQFAKKAGPTCNGTREWNG